jgi:hypothetical protein
MPIVNETFSDDAMEFPFSSKTCSVYFSLNNKAYDDSLIPKKQFIKKYNNILKYY